MVVARSAAPGRCTVCGELLGTAPHFITAVPDGEHVHCRDYSGRPFPHAKLLKTTRRQYRTMRAALREMEALGRWLAEREQLWPEGAAETVEELDGRLARVTASFESIRPVKK